MSFFSLSSLLCFSSYVGSEGVLLYITNLISWFQPVSLQDLLSLFLGSFAHFTPKTVLSMGVQVAVCSHGVYTCL